MRKNNAAAIINLTVRNSLKIFRNKIKVMHYQISHKI